MLNLQAMTVMHRHGDNWGEMSEIAPHGAEAHDPERQLLRGARIYRCEVCDEEIMVVPPEEAS